MTTIWTILSLPFRAVFKTAEVAGRSAFAVLGFVLMALGTGLGAASMYLMGVAVFGLGLFLMLRGLEG